MPRWVLSVKWYGMVHYHVLKFVGYFYVLPKWRKVSFFNFVEKVVDVPEKIWADGEMVYAHASGACGVTRGGSSPLPPTHFAYARKGRY